MERSEKAIQASIIRILKYNGYYVQRMNSGGMKSRYKIRSGPNRGKYKSHYTKSAATGTPDILAFKKKSTGTHLLFIEVKRPGKEPSQKQLMKMEELQEYGAECLTATCEEDVEEYIEK